LTILRSYLKKLFTAVFFLWITVSSATHIVGGEMTYTYLGTNQYRVRLDLYIDCINGDPSAISSDATAWIGVWDGSTRRIISGFPREVPRSGPERVQKTNYNCISIAPNACVDHYWYETTLTLAPRTGGYIISFQRCCRNNSISNLFDPGGTGANYWTAIPDARNTPNKKENSSAIFKELPPNFLCTNTPLNFDHSATDADGDSLAYDLFRPYTGGTRTQPRPNNNGTGTLENPPFSQITWGAGYSTASPIDGSPQLNIDPKTGKITLVPTVTGQFVVGIRVREYRKGVLISETMRDYQFNVQACVIDVVASYFVPTVVCGYTYQFRNQSKGGNRYHWDFGVAGTNTDTSNLYQPVFNFPAAGTYKIKLIAWKNNCSDTFEANLVVLKPEKPDLKRDTTICDGASLTLSSNLTGDSYLWSNGQTGSSITVTQPGTYWLELTKNTCKWRDTMVLTVDRTKVQIAGDTLYCSDEQFTRLLRATPGLKTYQWNTGATTPGITVNQSGIYIVNATTVNGCKSTDTAYINRFSPVVVSIKDTIVCPGIAVTFNNQNPTATATRWSNGETGASTTLTIPGTYVVRVTRGLCSTWDTFNLSNHPNTLELGPDKRFCERIDTLLMAPRNDFQSVVWNNEVPGSTFRLQKPGKVYVSVVNRYGCPEADSINVLLFPNPRVNLGNDTLVCLSVHPLLDAGGGMEWYRWQNGTTGRTYKAIDQGTYWVKVKDANGCFGTDTVTINKRGDLYPSTLFMPNAFTPDGNGVNDFYPMNKFPKVGALYNVKLYNRWGEKIIELESPDLNWDGNINGVPAPEGAYVYLATWIGCDNERRTLRGSFHILR
jgi:gliding motility-associated-like protein